MTTPTPDPTRWLLKITITSAPSDRHFSEQLEVLRPVASYDPATQTWSTLRGVFNLETLDVLQRLYGAAQRFATSVRLEAVAVPRYWQGPTLTADEDLVRELRTRLDAGRPLGQVTFG